MSNVVFTPPAGLKWDVKRIPLWSTTIMEATSGREYRSANYSYPRYEYKIGFDVLRMTGSYTEMATLVGFFNARQGAFDSFLFEDPDDYTVTDQSIGTGDGNTTNFQLVRTFGGYVEPVYDTHSVPVIKVANATKTAGVDYNIGTTALVVFANAPAAAASVTWTGTFYRRFRFKQDMAEFNQFMRLLWENWRAFDGEHKTVKSVIWETSAGALLAFLNSATQVYKVDLYTITLASGTVLRYTSGDVSTVANGVTFSIGPAIKRGKTRIEIGVAVNTVDMSIAADSSVTVNGVAMMAFIAAGGLDGARVFIEKVFSATPGGAWIGSLYVFHGRISETPSISRYKADFTLASDSELLNTKIPRNVYQAGCGNTLFDGSCGLAKATYAAARTATSVTDTARTTFSINGSQAADYFSLGWAVCLTGLNAGQRRAIKSSTTTTITTIQPWPFAVAVSDTFTLYPGCDKTMSTCNTKYSNLLRFRGMPFIPAPETIV